MKGRAYILHAPYLRLRRLALQYRALFPPMDERLHSLLVPPGWVDILRFAVEEAAARSENHVAVRSAWVRGDTLTADFIAGSEPARAMFLKTLEEAREYCPCCGGLWNPGEKERLLGE